MKALKNLALAAAFGASSMIASAQPDNDPVATAPEDRSFGISIEVETDNGSDESVENSTRRAVLKIVADVMEEIPQELRDEMSEEDKVKFERALEAIESGEFDEDSTGKQIVINANHGGEQQYYDWTGLVAVILLFGGPVAIVALVTRSNRRKREMVHSTIDRMIENGQEVPIELLDAIDKGKGGKSSLQRGTINVALGVGLGIALWNIADSGVATLALIPLCIGLAQLLVWRLESNNGDRQ